LAPVRSGIGFWSVGSRLVRVTLVRARGAYGSGGKIFLSQHRGKKNVVLSFVPAAWTPVCLDQWPGYNIVKHIFDNNDEKVPHIHVPERRPLEKIPY